MTDEPTAKIAEYIDKKGVSLVAIARATGISEGILRRCFSVGERDLRAGEFLRVCRFLERDPLEFKLGEEKSQEMAGHVPRPPRKET